MISVASSCEIFGIEHNRTIDIPQPTTLAAVRKEVSHYWCTEFPYSIGGCHVIIQNREGNTLDGDEAVNTATASLFARVIEQSSR